MFNQNFNKLKYFLHCSRQQEQIHRPSEATLPKPFYRSRISTSTKECKHESLLTHLFFELKISVKMKKKLPDILTANVIKAYIKHTHTIP